MAAQDSPGPAAAFGRVGEYEAWLRQFVRLAESGRELATRLAESARRHGQRMNEQRFSSHAERLYKEEVYWTLQIQGVASLAAATHVEKLAAKKAAAPRVARTAKPASRSPRATT
jgi:hypothetical protein